MVGEFIGWVHNGEAVIVQPFNSGLSLPVRFRTPAGFSQRAVEGPVAGGNDGRSMGRLS